MTASALTVGQIAELLEQARESRTRLVCSARLMSRVSALVGSLGLDTAYEVLAGPVPDDRVLVLPPVPPLGPDPVSDTNREEGPWATFW